MERTHTVDSGKPQTDPYSDNIIPMPPEGMLVRSEKIKKSKLRPCCCYFWRQ